MIVEKVLNNNVVVSIDPNTRKEVILMGSGIAFNKKPGQLIDDKKIEKTFIVDDENLGNKIKKLINQIPEGIFEITDEIITYAIVELNVELDKQIYISLADHIAFAIKRYKRDRMALRHERLDRLFLDAVLLQQHDGRRVPGLVADARAAGQERFQPGLLAGPRKI